MSEISKEEFCARFIAELVRIVGPIFNNLDEDGRPIEGGERLTADYAAEVAPTYWDGADQRDEGPEECARTDFSYWEE